MGWLVFVLVVVVVAVLLIIAVWAFRTANRLDRLHVRYDLSWQALDAALARRAVVARAVAVDAYGDALEGRRFDGAGGRGVAPRQAREAAENELSTALAAVNQPAFRRRPDRRTRRRRSPGCAGPAVPQRRRARHRGAARTPPGSGPCGSAAMPRGPGTSRSPSPASDEPGIR